MDIHAGANTHSGQLSVVKKIASDFAVGKNAIFPGFSHAEHFPEPSSAGRAEEGAWVTITTPIQMLWERVRYF